MPQSKIRSLQLNSSDFKEIVETALGAPLNITAPLTAGTALTLSGSPIQWTPVSGGGSSVQGGDGITVTGGSPIGSVQTVAVDSTVARTNITTETFSFAGAVSLNLNDTSQAADEDIWRVGVTGSNFIIATRTDADAAGINAISITRTGTAVDDITMPSPLLLTSSGTASTSAALQVTANAPAIVINDTDSAANAGVWDVAGDPNQLLFRTRTDAFGTGATWLTVNRSGTTVGEIALAGTSLTFNGLAVHVGSPQPSGGGATLDATVARLAAFIPGGGSPYGSPIGGLVNTAPFITTSDIKLRTLGGGQGDFSMFAQSVGSRFAFTVQDEDSNDGIILYSDGQSTFGFAPGFEASGSTTLRGDDITIQSDTTTVKLQNAGTSVMKVTAPNASSGFGTLWIAHQHGSPQFVDNHTSTTLPTLRVGIGSPVTTSTEATVAIMDHYGVGLTLLDTNTRGEMNWRLQSNNEFITRGSNFTTWTVHDLNSDNSYTYMSIQHETNPTIQFQNARIGDVKLNARTNNNISSSDTGWGSYSTNNNVFFVEPNGNIVIGGMASGKVEGQWLTVINATAGPGSPATDNTITFEHEEGTATASNRFLLPNKRDVLLRANDSIQLIYDSNVSRWRCMATTGVQVGGSPLI